MHLTNTKLQSINWKWLLKGLAKSLIAVAIIWAPLEAFDRSGYRIGWDTTLGDSCLPFTFYIYEPHNMDIKKGDYFAFKARRMTPYYEDDRIIIKEVVGIEGDQILVTDKVYVNGVYRGDMPHIKKLKKTLEDFSRNEVVPNGKLWAMGTHPRSFDSRYWGYVEQQQIIGKAFALW